MPLEADNRLLAPASTVNASQRAAADAVREMEGEAYGGRICQSCMFGGVPVAVLWARR